MKELISAFLVIIFILTFVIWIIAVCKSKKITVKNCRIKFVCIFIGFLCNLIQIFLGYNNKFQIFLCIIFLISSILHYYLLNTVKKDEKYKEKIRSKFEKSDIIDLEYEEIE